MHQAETKTHLNALSVAPQPFLLRDGTPMGVRHRAQVLAEQGVEIDLLTYGMHSSLPQQLTNFDFANDGLVVELFCFLEGLSLRHCDEKLPTLGFSANV